MDYLMTKSEFESTQGLDTIATDVSQLVSFSANETAFNQLNPAPDSDEFVSGDFTGANGDIRVPASQL